MGQVGQCMGIVSIPSSCVFPDSRFPFDCPPLRFDVTTARAHRPSLVHWSGGLPMCLDDEHCLRGGLSRTRILATFVWILIGLCATLPIMGITSEAGAGTRVVKSSRDPVFVQAQLPASTG